MGSPMHMHTVQYNTKSSMCLPGTYSCKCLVQCFLFILTIHVDFLSYVHIKQVEINAMCHKVD